MSPTRALRRLVVLVLATLTALVASAGVASAHVGVSSTDAAPGGFGKLTFRVPNESDSARTVSVRIQIPQESALASLRAQPVPGWTVTLTQSDLEVPLESHGQQISTYVSVVEFRAVDGGGIGPGEFQEFALSGGPFPDVDAVTFPTVQAYSDGSESAWIEPTVGDAEPEHPAPTLTLTASGDPASATTEVDTAGATEESDQASPGALALFIAVLALLVGIAGVVLGWRAGRRTVSS